MDCDETFNYWEVVHFLLYQFGFQTWEYSNEFALRTYAYLTPMVGVAKFYQWVLPFVGSDHGNVSWFWSMLTKYSVTNEKIALFVLLRASLGIWTAIAEITFCQAIAELGNVTEWKKGKKASSWYLLVAFFTEVLLLTSAGMGHAAAALLPSSTLMGMWLFAAAAYLRHQHTLFATLAVTATLAIGWPFGVIMFIPLGFSVLFREYCKSIKHLFLLIIKIVFITLAVQGTVMAIDYYHYKRIVSPVWNILMYNTQAGGDELYGVEPFSYYVKNLLLNLNYVAAIGMLAGLLLPLLITGGMEGWILLLPMYMWLTIVAPRPHKEERFLFPIYPCLCFGAAALNVWVVDAIISWMSTDKMRRPRREFTVLFVNGIIWAPAILFSFARTAALVKYYSAPLSVYADLPATLMNENTGQSTIICTCGEWYRFPSSFFVPDGSTSFGFAPSTFGGQLPQHFTKAGSGPSFLLSDGTPNIFNDLNQPEPASYTPLHTCNYLIELSTSLTSCTEQLDGFVWQPKIHAPFLDASATSSLHRILYIPLLHDNGVEQGEVLYGDFVLYSKAKADNLDPSKVE
jgi:alpha-1,2-mannosyltransferase